MLSAVPQPSGVQSPVVRNPPMCQRKIRKANFLVLIVQRTTCMLNISSGIFFAVSLLQIFLPHSAKSKSDTGVRPYSCGLCRDTFSRSDILKRHFQKCSVRRGNPSGENHLSHSRAHRKAKLEPGEEIAASDGHALTVPVQSSQPPDFSLHSSFDLGAMSMNQPNFSGEHHGLPDPGSRSNSVKRASNGVIVGNRAQAGGPTSSFDASGFPTATGHVTPDSITDSGAATPYPYAQDSRSQQFPSNTSFSQATSGHPLDLSANNRAALASNYSNGSLPQIVESSQGRGNELDWTSLFQSSGQGEYVNHPYQSSIDGTHPPVKTEPHFSSVPFSLAPDYPQFLPAKV